MIFPAPFTRWIVEHINAVQDQVTAYLESKSDAQQLIPESHEIAVQTNEEIIDQIESALNTLTGFVTGIAVISLVVGAIGIANIMPVSRHYCWSVSGVDRRVY